ncbi:insulinase family protein [Marinifilum fragile]|uniref:M16 family metallopeptidase n=1 Tax=Marinifilum fragile TaxID=570161 RepID=UPI002AA961CF|nr:insulinase family protein [Marinifilum fragile]
MKKFLSLLVMSVILFSGNFSQAQNTTTIPLNPKVKHGKLSNGMTYYVMHNEEPKDRASLYFVQNVGAILEEDAQNGLAHFLEHMAFNGLKNFPGKNMINYLEKNGIQFGRDINAYTAQDETVYNISNLPTGNENLIDSALLVLHDWSGGLLLEAEEIESERGVIHEEWRTRRNSRFRINSQTSPVMYNHSQYAKRDVIGDLNVIDNFEHKQLRDYYKKWYRPDNQAVVVVGDFDVEKIEAKVKALFSKIPMPKNAAERVYYQVEDSKETQYVLAKDKEAKSVSINWIFRKPAYTTRDENYMRESLVQGMFNTMLNNRLKELMQNPECPAVGMSVGNFGMCRTKEANYLYVAPKENKEIEAFETFMTEFARVQRFGFTETELERVKTSFLRSYESYLQGKDKISNEDWAQTFQEHYLSANPAPSVEWEVEFGEKTIPSITLMEVNSMLKNYGNINNSVFALSGPDKEEIKYPTKEELFASIKKVMTSNIEAYADETGDAPLVTDELTDKKFASESVVKGTDAKLYTLENGARVVVLPTDYSKDEILFNAYSFGGSSLLEREDLESGDVATMLAKISGVGEFNAIQLRKKLTGKIAGVQPALGSYTETFSGSASPKDFETMLQLLYQYFEHPRFDENVFQAQMGAIKNNLQNVKADNGKALKDTIEQMMANHHERALMFNEEFVNNIDFEKAKKIYLDRFKDASDFTFLFVGNIDEEKHLPLIRKYIGSISSENRKENWVDRKVRMPEGKSQNIFEREMQVPKTTVYLSLKNEMKYNLETRMYARVVAELLSKRYMETIREQEGGTYGVSVRPSISKRPYENVGITISFDCGPEKQERLRELVYQEIDAIVKTVNETDLEEIKKNYIKNRAEAVKENSFWLSVIQSSLMNNEPIINTESYNNLVNSISAKKVEEFAKKLFKKYDSVEVVMNPKKS